LGSLHTSKVSGESFKDFRGVSGVTKSGVTVLAKPPPKLACRVAVVDGETSVGSGFLLLASRIVASTIKRDGVLREVGRGEGVGADVGVPPRELVPRDGAADAVAAAAFEARRRAPAVVELRGGLAGADRHGFTP
jgi:hypothetical protein